MLTFLYSKFTQDSTYQILSQSVMFCRAAYEKKHFGVFFSVHSVDYVTQLMKIQKARKLVTLQHHFFDIDTILTNYRDTDIDTIFCK